MRKTKISRRLKWRRKSFEIPKEEFVDMYRKILPALKVSGKKGMSLKTLSNIVESSSNVPVFALSIINLKEEDYVTTSIYRRRYFLTLKYYSDREKI